MNELKRTLHIFWGQLLYSLSNIRVWLGYFIGIFAALKSAHLYCGYAGDHVIQIFEPSIIHFSNMPDIILSLIGFMVIISDAPFINTRSVLAIYRSKRSQWYWAMCIYITVHCFLYYIVSLIASCLYCMRLGYLQNLWSQPMTGLANKVSLEWIFQWHLNPVDPTLITDYTPAASILHTILLLILFSLILALVMYIFNMLFNKAVGTAVTAAVYILGYVTAFDSWNEILRRWSLYLNSIFMSHLNSYINILSSYFYLLLIVCILLFMGPIAVRHADFKLSSGEQNE